MRRGVALLDVLVAAMVLAVGMGITMSLASQSLLNQGTSERRITASWLADGLLSMVLAEGPRRFSMRQQPEGRFDPPFDDFTWLVEVRSLGDWVPYSVQATIAWQEGASAMSLTFDTRIAPRQGEEDDWADWRPEEPLDREARAWPDEEEEASGPEAGG